MSKNKAWDWKNEHNPRWLIPSEDSYYFLHRWKDLGFKNIIDLGCGRGRHSLLFADNGFNVTALDLSDYSVQELKNKSNDLDLVINCVVSDMMELPFGDNDFDCLFAYHVISHSDSKGVENTISEVRRVLKDKGEMFVTFGSSETLNMVNKDLIEFIEPNVIIKKQGTEKGVPHYYLDEFILKELLKGFNIISIRKIQNIDLVNDKKYGYHYFVHAEVNK